MTRALTVALAVLLLAAAAAPAADVFDRAAAGLRAHPVYLDPDAPRVMSPEQRRALEAQIAADRAAPLYIAILPAGARKETGDSATKAAREVARRLGRDGVYAVLVGSAVRAGQVGAAGVPSGTASRVMTEAFGAHRPQGPYAVLSDFVTRIGAAKSAAGGGSGGGPGLLLVLGAAALGGGALLVRSRRRRRRAEDEHAADLRRAADEDRAALGEDIRALDLDVEMPGADARAKEDYGRALDAFERAGTMLATARRPADFEALTGRLEEGRWAMESAKARLAGREPPERRPPCFFDPRHGPSARDVEWAPPGGAPRPVPTCEADAQRVERGEEPTTRELELAGNRVPWYH